MPAAMVTQQTVPDTRSKCYHGLPSSKMATRMAPSDTVSFRQPSSSTLLPQHEKDKSYRDFATRKKSNSEVALVDVGVSSPCRGLRLLIKAKEFHLAVRGLKETTGFQYMAAQPSRNERDIVAAACHLWDVESECLPPDVCRFWKLTRSGAVYAVTTAETLFQQREKGQSRPQVEIQLEEDRQNRQTNSGQRRQQQFIGPATQRVQNIPRTSILIPTAMAMSSLTGLGDSRLYRRQGKQCQQQQTNTQSTSTLISAPTTKVGRRNTSVTATPTKIQINTNGGAPTENPPIQASHDSRIDTGEWYCSARARDNSDSGKGIKAIVGISPKLDRFGHRIQSRCSRRIGSPWGTLEPLGWGWGGEFRFGNGRDGEELEPKRLNSAFKERRLVDIAAGKRITLFVSDEGLVFSVGEGLRWQLGTISAFSTTTVARAVQRLPKQVHPSGELKVGRDFRVAQAAAGDAFCVTREANVEDAVRATEGFLWMKTGRLLSWGTGHHGELGLGPHVLQRRTPCVIRSLSSVAVASVAAGAAHVLCVTLDGQVYSWGQGKDGRLGHGDPRDRWDPCRVKGLGLEPVSLISAGKAHSMAVSLPQTVHVWGRGAHGRLGIGDNRCRNRPVRLKSWPPGFLGRTVQSIALGGAHSVLLAHRGVNTTLANPWGTESVAYAWGYGFCGQLGLGEQVGEIQTPRKVAFDNKELITAVAAGKSYSLASNVQGQLFAWGKGWMGEIGLGKDKDFRVVPTRVDFPGAGTHLVVKFAAGERHASALALVNSPPAKGWDKEKQWELLGSQAGLKKWESSLLHRWRCPRRPPWNGSGSNPEPLFSCLTCALSCVCRQCARSCHHGHKVGPCSRTLRVLCECGMQPCGAASDDRVDTGSNRGRTGEQVAKTSCRLLPTVEDYDSGDTAIRWNRNAVKCQRVVRGWFGRRSVRIMNEKISCLRRKAVEAVWYVGVLGAMERSILRFDKDEERERDREGMAAADVESTFYRYYTKLQPVIQALNQQREALRDFSTREGVTLETRASRLDPRVARGHAPRETITLWSRRAVRQLQRQLPPALRLVDTSLVKLTSALPAGGWSSGSFCRGSGGCGAGAGALGGVPDPDVDALLRSSQTQRKRLTVDVAAPEGLYERVKRMRAAQLRRLTSHRRASFSEGDSSTRVDKHRSMEDHRWASMLSRYWIGVDNSLGATRYLQITWKKCDKLTDQHALRGRRGARALHKFLRSFGPGSVDPDVASVRERARRGRAHSLCAPERLYASTVTWETRHDKLQKLLRAAAKRGLPASGDSMKWTRTAERWGERVPPAGRQAVTIGNLKKSAHKIVMRAIKRGWDLHPSRPGTAAGGRNTGTWTSTGVWRQEVQQQRQQQQALVVASAMESSSWSAHEDGNGNTYYVNDSTGESAWELPGSPSATTTQGDVAIVGSKEGLSSWSARDDGKCSTYYVNDSAVEGACELPNTTTATPLGSDIVTSGQQEDEWWAQEEEEENASGRDAQNAGGHHYASRIDSNNGGGAYNGLGDQYWGHGTNGNCNPTGGNTERNPFGGNHHETWLSTTTGGATATENAYYGGNLELAQSRMVGGEGGGWSQEWDEGNQGYYWYNAASGESHW